MAEEILIMSSSVAALTKALLGAKKEFGPVLRNKENPFFKRNGVASKYADLTAAIEATEDSLSKHGLIVSQFPINDGDKVGVLTMVIHESGEYIGRGFALPIIKQDAQTGTAAVTYARRTAYLSALGIAAEDDDDGNAASEPEKSVPKQQKVTSPTKAAQVPKAEIPSEPLGKPTAQPGETDRPKPVSSSIPMDGALPNDEQLQSIRNRFSLLNKDLADAGLKPSKGLPIGRKLTLYLLHRTGMSDAEKVTYSQWQKFFDECAAHKDNGFKTLVELINSIVEEKK